MIMQLSLTTDKLLSRPDCMLRVLFFNAQSVGQLHQQGMTADVFLYSAHVLALSETWIRGNINIPDNVHSLYCPRLNESRGGVALLSVNNCKMRNTSFPVTSTLEAQADLLTFQGGHINIMVLYWTPKMTTLQLAKYLESHYQVIDLNLPTIAGNDFNINFLTKSGDNPLLQFMASHGFPHTHQYVSLLDLIWTKCIIPVVKVWTYYSGHLKLFCDVCF